MYIRVFYLMAIVLVAGCSGGPKLGSAEAIAALKDLNAKLRGDFADVSQPWPYTEQYLSRRHEIYAQIQPQQLSQAQRRTFDYLRTEERFVRRYQPWPMLFDLAGNQQALSEPATQEQIANWLHYVQSKLKEGERSKIYVNRVELEHMQTQLSTLSHMKVSAPLSGAISMLQTYLARYIPRNQLGLSQLPNGADWLQTKLNYFSEQVHSPIQWMTAIQKRQQDIQLKGVFELPQPKLADLQSDLDWRQDFKSMKLWASQQSLSVEQQYMALLVMEVDLGVHAQLWDRELVYTALAQRGVTPDIAETILEQVLLHPGRSFIYAWIIDEI